ncbi:xanthine/CO dehydrogenase XdhC/CoxF family maturation factor [Prosthecobacter fusiformis]|uniref:Xanthine/CO dehydrogenase XdhC/CoxF family maturation factor n=1 Tax=Prosthecobacter fusiformis TaxID=48464 RepID=A0A4R7RXQ6_9BACT|nr:XdhC family protein [Prosthecobacter fusiformis]TDU70571.1 xanthine/CO dehydrogenase XdhC/CoxF family maturation factor [Prosthecobacter fusiformis]
MKELRDILAEYARCTSSMGLATIVSTTGSSYRKTGARMLILPDGRTVGTLSGGCIEEEVAQRALHVMETGEPALLSIDTRRRFGCHGSIEIFVEKIEPGDDFMGYLSDCISSRRPAHVKVIFEAGHSQRGSYPEDEVHMGIGGHEELILPPVRLVVCGDSPGNEALMHLAKTLGWDCILLEHPEDSTLAVDERTAIVIKNHHFGRDFVSLRWALSHSVGYVGLLGSRKRKQELMNALVAEGWEPEDASLNHFHSPAGLDLGAEEPEQIALSITAEILAVLSRHHAGFLRDRQGPIHHILCTSAAL